MRWAGQCGSHFALMFVRAAPTLWRLERAHKRHAPAEAWRRRVDIAALHVEHSPRLQENPCFVAALVKLSPRAEEDRSALLGEGEVAWRRRGSRAAALTKRAAARLNHRRGAVNRKEAAELVRSAAHPKCSSYAALHFPPVYDPADGYRCAIECVERRCGDACDPIAALQYAVEKEGKGLYEKYG